MRYGGGSLRIASQFAVGCLLLTGGRLPIAAAEEPPLDLAVKATFLYKFAAFTAWPDGTAGFRADTFSLCVVGPEAFGTLLDEVVRDQSVFGYRITIRRFANLAANPGCQILYVAPTDPSTVHDWLTAVRGTPVLTVTDGEQAPGTKGIINFVILGNRVRFEIDPDSASANRLTLSSKLLSLAVNTPTQP